MNLEWNQILAFSISVAGLIIGLLTHALWVGVKYGSMIKSIANIKSETKRLEHCYEELKNKGLNHNGTSVYITKNEFEKQVSELDTRFKKFEDCSLERYERLTELINTLRSEILILKYNRGE